MGHFCLFCNVADGGNITMGVAITESKLTMHDQVVAHNPPQLSASINSGLHDRGASPWRIDEFDEMVSLTKIEIRPSAPLKAMHY